jgi:hypothetical protein
VLGGGAVLPTDKVIINLINKRDNSGMSEYPASQEVTCKKIQNYIFNFSDLLGQGNFSKVYKAHNEVTSKPPPTQGRPSRSRSSSSTASRARNSRSSSSPKSTSSKN